MYLKKVEINGFKSFANKEIFDLSPGITCFVGPNGCGKSNVVDAIKWALGEQRVSSLRGDKMQDVIFKGNGTVPPMNFAEVSLYFDNSCATLDVDYEEVVTTRRLYRTGESEYLLNHTGCRLKDIKNLFMDTGIGVNAYSMMEQGRIDSILQTDPVSRRAIFEEASGISRFKTRKKEAERKLERTNANLLRVGDILEELEKRIRSLKNQAGRARNYLKNSDRLKEIKREFYLHQYAALVDERGSIEKGKAEAEAEAEKAYNHLMAQKEAVSDFEKKIDLLGESLYSQKNMHTEAKTSQEETQIKVGYFEKRVTELDNEQEELDLREKELESTLEVKEKDLVEIRDRLQNLGDEARKVEEEASGIAEQQQRFEKEWQQAIQSLKTLESEAMDLSRQEVELKNRAIEVSARLNGAHTGIMRINSRQNTLVGNMAEVKQLLRRVERDLVEREAERTRLQTELAEGRDRALEAEERLRVLDTDLKRIEDEILKRETRIEVLQNLIDRREGVGRGVRKVLEEASRESSPLDFIHGMLGELLDVDVDHSTALEAALGKTSEAIVVDDLSQADAVIRYLRKEGLGRIKLLPLSAFQSSDDANPVTARSSTEDDLLMNHVRCKDPKLGHAIHALLGDVRIISEAQLMGSTDIFSGMSSGNGSSGTDRFRGVTLGGDLLDEHGILTIGGSAPEQGVISRRSEMAALEKERDEFEVQVREVAQNRQAVKDEIERMTRSNTELADRISSQSQIVATLSAECEKHLERWDIIRKEYNLNAWDAYDLEQNIHSLKGSMGELHDKSKMVAQGLDEVHHRIREARAIKDTHGVEKERLAEKRRQCEFQRVQLTERKEGIEKECRLTENNLKEVRAHLEDLGQDRNRIASMRTDIGAQLEEMKQRATELLEKRSSLAAAIAEMELQLEAEKTTFEEYRKDAESTEETLEDVRRRIDNFRIDERGNLVKREGLIEKAGEELSLDLEDESLMEEVDRDPDRNWQATEIEIEDLKQRLSRMGNVNLEAIHELQEVEERFETLSTQRTDLVKSIKSLEELVTQLKEESREKFMETFEAVRSHFNDIFRKLFQGGRADVKLKEGEDILEAGIEIIAGPPGKDVRSISLLSGGERTLTAVGLLFALFKSRPSPFCILDEVDAALDELNIERFCNILGDYVRESQFLIITHSKRTMSFCDYLYGITMQEDGITTHIALNLETYEDQVA